MRLERCIVDHHEMTSDPCDVCGKTYGVGEPHYWRHDIEFRTHRPICEACAIMYVLENREETTS